MKNELAMQSRCVHCLREQYIPAVSEISRGEHPCVWCGEMSKPMTYEEYGIALDKKRNELKNNQS